MNGHGKVVGMGTGMEWDTDGNGKVWEWKKDRNRIRRDGHKMGMGKLRERIWGGNGRENRLGREKNRNENGQWMRIRKR